MYLRQAGWRSIGRWLGGEYGLAHRDLSGITAIGVDEVQFQRGHKI